MAKKNKTPRYPRVILKSGEDRAVRTGNPWIFDTQIATTRGHMPLATLVQVLDADESSLGHGLYSASSKIRVRMLPDQLALPNEPGAPLTSAFFEDALRRCVQRRALFGYCTQDTPLTISTEVFRLCNSEGDGLPGLLIDVLGELVVVQITTQPMHRLREEIFTALAMLFPEHAILDIPAPEKIMELEGFEVTHTWRSEHQPARIVIKESDVSFELLTEAFQKTGHYADMRPHRHWLAGLSNGKRVLDAYAYTGGFGLHAAAGGALSVVCVDSSARAAKSAEANVKLNQFNQIEVVTSKVDTFLEAAAQRGDLFDVIVLDPPKFAPNRRVAHKALKVYESICMQGIAVTAPGGLLCVTSCSEAIGERDLVKVLAQCAGKTGRSIFVNYVGAQGPDHPWPAGMKEGHYATFVAAYVS